MNRRLTKSLMSISCIFNLGQGAFASSPTDHDTALRHTHTCNADACIIAYAIEDTDGDGYSDVDEQAAGTDPNDATSHPTVTQFLDLVGRGLIPNTPSRLIEVVILPTLTRIYQTRFSTARFQCRRRIRTRRISGNLEIMRTRFKRSLMAEEGLLPLPFTASITLYRDLTKQTPWLVFPRYIRSKNVASMVIGQSLFR